jgi:hypothetical protein
MRGFEKIFWTPLMCQCAFLRPREDAHARFKNFVLPVLHVLHQNETTAEDDRTQKNGVIDTVVQPTLAMTPLKYAQRCHDTTVTCTKESLTPL